ncbi:threonine/homoserine/homoserine lactone efflux protein [Rhodoligotrophos appendicifer]|uniref:LysE family translocator n=1 Tax=Rhodoligotrophos appendicifer TaxID=987056 RepID=UPI00118508B7|nr:LysE family transporter [Rhodoligotrophos appendicifer]
MSSALEFSTLGSFPIFLAYLLYVLTPGPIMLAIGCMSSMRGFRAAMPMVFGICLGTFCLALLVAMVTAHAATMLSPTTLYVVASLALLWAAYRIARSSPVEVDSGRDLVLPAVSLVSAGLLIAVSDPMTAAFMAATFTGPHLEQRSSMEGMAILAMMFALPKLGWHVIVALTFSRPLARAVALRRQLVIRLAASTLLVAAAASCAVKAVGLP